MDETNSRLAAQKYIFKNKSFFSYEHVLKVHVHVQVMFNVFIRNS
jgi:hypothetical protein